MGSICMIHMTSGECISSLSVGRLGVRQCAQSVRRDKVETEIAHYMNELDLFGPLRMVFVCPRVVVVKVQSGVR